MNFQLQSCRIAHQEIKNRIGLRLKDVSDEMKIRLEDLDLYGDDFIIHKSVISLMGLNGDTLKQVIGRDGYYFILTTRSCNLDFIWHNTYNNTIEFWGPNQYSLKKGMYEINKRILNVQML